MGCRAKHALERSGGIGGGGGGGAVCVRDGVVGGGGWGSGFDKQSGRAQQVLHHPFIYPAPPPPLLAAPAAGEAESAAQRAERLAREAEARRAAAGEKEEEAHRKRTEVGCLGGVGRGVEWVVPLERGWRRRAASSNRWGWGCMGWPSVIGWGGLGLGWAGAFGLSAAAKLAQLLSQTGPCFWQCSHRLWLPLRLAAAPQHPVAYLAPPAVQARTVAEHCKPEMQQAYNTDCCCPP